MTPASGTVRPVYTGAQLTSASAASRKYGVPVNLVRSVTGYKYGAGATDAQFAYTASQLARWYRTFYKTSGGTATEAWQRAAAQEMPGASALQVTEAASTQAAAQLGISLSALQTDLGVSLTGGDAAPIGADPGVPTDPTTGAPSAADVNAATDPATTGASSATAADGAAAGAAGLTALEKLAKDLGTAGVLLMIWDALKDPKNWQRALELIGGTVLLSMAIKSLSGVSTPDLPGPVAAARAIA